MKSYLDMGLVLYKEMTLEGTDYMCRVIGESRIKTFNVVA